MATRRTYQVKDVSRIAGVSVRTLHHYDTLGLLVPTRRSAAGYRLYDDDDLLRLQQILANLTSNALKFTEAGSVRVYVYKPQDNQWIIQVSDTGPGIPVEAWSLIFEPFRQVDGSMTRKHGGVGLGLSIVKQLATLLGGEVSLESEVGRGSTFTVRLPLVLPPEERINALSHSGDVA